jgi:DNA-binding XRE family transcriptional regulator
MAMHNWADVEQDLFPGGDEDQVRAIEDQIRAEVRAYKLAEIRKARHLTQEQIAATLGVTKAGVSQIERGQRPLPFRDWLVPCSRRTTG